VKQRSPRQKLAALLWLTALGAALLYCAVKLLGGHALESNVLALLPAQFSAAAKGKEGGDLEKRFALLVGPHDTALSVAQVLQQQLSTTPELTLNTDGDAFASALAFYRPFSQQLLSPDQRKYLRTTQARVIAEQTFQDIISPVATLRPYPLQEDPFNLGGGWADYLLKSPIEPGAMPMLKDQQSRWFLITGSVNDSPFSPSTQQALRAALADFQASYPDIELIRSGIVFHAAEATRLSQREISTVGLGSLAAIFAIVTLVFRNPRDLLIIGGVLSASAVVALAACLLLFERVHLITLAFGSTLLGLAVDYCFHLLIKYRQLGSAERAYRLLRRSLWLGVTSSIAAYAFQLLSPLSGLHQFAVFMAAGLTGAAITLAVIHPFFQTAPAALLPIWPGLYQHHVSAVYLRLSGYRKTLSLALTITALTLLGSVLQLTGNDDVRTLNTSSESLLASEAKARELLQLPDSSRFFAVNAADEQALLERTTELAQTLEQSLNGEPLPAALVLGRLVPTQNQQRADFALIQDKLYGPTGALRELCQLIPGTCSWQERAAPTFNNGLTLQADTRSIDALFPALLFSESTQSRLMLPANTELAVADGQALARQHRARYHDTPAELSAALGEFRQSATRYLLVFLVLFALAMLALYRRRAAVPISTLGLVLLISVAAATSGGLSLFHVLALLLVIGLTVDSVIFYLDIGLNAHSWLAASMASLTSILAFGLLSLSTVPVLQQFGSIVFWGLLASWLLTPAVVLLFDSSPAAEQ